MGADFRVMFQQKCGGKSYYSKNLGMQNVPTNDQGPVVFIPGFECFVFLQNYYSSFSKGQILFVNKQACQV